MRLKPRGGQEKGEEPSSKDKSLHRQIEEVAGIEKSNQWIEEAGVEQALSTRVIEAWVYHIRQDPRCRLCKEASETVQPIVVGCKMQAGMAYMERYNQVAGIVYRNICADYGLEVPKSKWETVSNIKQEGIREALSREQHEGQKNLNVSSYAVAKTIKCYDETGSHVDLSYQPQRQQINSISN